MPIRGRYNPFNLTAFNKRLRHDLLILAGATNSDHDARYVNLAGDIMTGILDMGGNNIDLNGGSLINTGSILSNADDQEDIGAFNNRYANAYLSALLIDNASDTDAIITFDGTSNNPLSLTYESDNALLIINKDVQLDAGLTVNDLIITSPATQNYKIGAAAFSGEVLSIESSLTGTQSRISLSTFDGDGTDNVTFDVFAVGSNGVGFADSERLSVGWDTGDNIYKIRSRQAGLGSLRNILLTADDSTTQMILQTDGDISIANGLTVDTDTLVVDSTLHFVGVGIDPPATLFHVSSTDIADTILRLSNAGDAGQNLDFAYNSATNVWSFNTGVTRAIQFKQNNVTQLQITTTGNVDITNGLTVDTDTLVVIDATNRVGIEEPDPETLLEMTSTVPYLTLHNNTEEDTDGGRESRINFKGEQSGAEETTLVRIEASHDGAVDDEKGKIVFSTNAGSDTDTPTVAITIDSNQDIVMSDHAITNLGSLQYNSATELTISSGAVTTTQAHHSIDTEADAANDDLDTINGGSGGEILLILPANDARTVRLRHGVGNIFLKHQVESKSFSFSSPAGSSGTFYSAGYYNWSSTEAALTESALSVTHSAANSPSACHIGIVAGGIGVVDLGVIKLTVTGTTIDDDGNRAASQTVDLVADITTLSTDDYVETTEKWIGQVTIALAVASGSPVNFNLDINYGCSKYEDFGNQAFTVTVVEVVGLAGANDTGFNLRLFHHSAAGWTFAASGFVPGGTVLADMNSDYSTEKDLANGESFAYKRVNLNTDITGDNSEGLVLEITTSANKAVEIMDLHLGVHTAPNFAYLATTKQHLIFMKHGPNWLEL